ncbi:tetratricopeptide repeat protein [Paludibaculum fermentans]|uniref:tetratricopeptide repeat protein n=1 Tax=Paludibaculum fermentans TaxID=1473598 RepID=UPI003EBE1A41
MARSLHISPGMRSIYCRACFCLLLAGLPVRSYAQSGSDDAGGIVTGNVETGGASTFGFMVVLSSDASFDRRADLDMHGGFHFFGIPKGDYELSVTTVTGAVLHREYVFLRSPTNRLSIRLPTSNSRLSRGGAATVSAARLLHKVPSNARKEFARGMKAASRMHSAEAIEHLARSIELDPGFVEAYNNLGTQYLQANAYETARSYFQKAIELDTGAPEAHVNLALSLLKLRRYLEAETAARVAIRMAGNDPASHYYLGIALLNQSRNPIEAIDALQRACDSIPRARLAIAIVSQRRGDMERAKKELQAYLNQRTVENRRSVEEWLANLQQPAIGEHGGISPSK